MALINLNHTAKRLQTASAYDDYDNAVAERLLRAEKMALKVFHEAAERVPAYKDFLKKNSVSHKTVRNFSDFQKLPLINKDNYLRQYPMHELMWDGDRFQGELISVSSGSSGEPFFLLRDSHQQHEAGQIYFDMYKKIFNADKVPTLLVVCFSMGTWIAGTYTTLGALSAKSYGLKLNIVTPGIELTDAVTVIKRLQTDYEQIILAGYPPFLKDLVDKGKLEGINWKKLNVGFTAAGESLIEELRDYFISRGTAYKEPHKVINIYGTVDAGVVAHETPLSVILKRNIYHNKSQESHFGSNIVPTLAQYDPDKKFIEGVDGNIIFTSGTATPLVRYNINDSGGTIFKLADLVDNDNQFSETASKLQLNITDWQYPFVYVHGRKDFTSTLYAVLIYPENIKRALFHFELDGITTARFLMATKNKKNLDQYLEINVELCPGVKATKLIAAKIEKIITNALEEDNAEYRKLKASIGLKARPVIILHPAGDNEFFARSNNKQKWTNTRN